MVDPQDVTLRQPLRMPPIEETTIQELAASVRGELLRLGDDGFDEARKVWNGMINKVPALIVRCAGVADVISAVDFARINELLVAVRGGGHNVAGNAVCDGGIVIDLSRMKGMRVDPTAGTARAQAGLVWGEFDRETQAFGLATTGGVVSTTGIAGFTLGGGLGWLMHSYGLACDNLLSADVVVADGRFVTASASENEDLFWAVRGGGGNFGVVTSFEYRLHPVGPVVLAGPVFHPLPKARDILRFYREYVNKVPDKLTAHAFLTTSPDGVPMVGVMVCYSGRAEDGEEVVQPLREFGPPVMDQVGPVPYTMLQSMLDATGPPGLQNYWKSSVLPELGDEAIDTIVARFAEVPSPRSLIIIENLGGAVSHVGEDETAFPHRDGGYNFLIQSTWPDPTDSERNIRWTRDLYEAMRPFMTDAVYVNYLGQEGVDRVKEAYGAAKYERLVALKNKYDPTNLFRLNQNIKPKGQGGVAY